MNMIFVFFLLTCTAPLCAAEEQSVEPESRVVYIFDTGVLCTKQDQKKQILSLGKELFPKHKMTVLRGLAMYIAYRTGWRKIDGAPNGTTNIVLAHLKELCDMGYDDLRSNVSKIVEASLNPEPNHAVIDEIKKLTQQVPPPHIVIATNQDYLQHQCWRKKMAERGVDIDKLVDSTVTAWCPADYVPQDKKEIAWGSSKYTQFADGSVMCPENVTTKSPEYFYIASKVIAQKAPNAEVVIYTAKEKDKEALENAMAQENFATVPYPAEIIQKGPQSWWARQVQGVLKKRGL